MQKGKRFIEIHRRYVFMAYVLDTAVFFHRGSLYTSYIIQISHGHMLSYDYYSLK